jgi:hypothetical protein
VVALALGVGVAVESVEVVALGRGAVDASQATSTKMQSGAINVILGFIEIIS